MRTKPMTFEEHQELGKQVKEVIRLLWCIFSKVSAHYGKTHIMMKSLRIAQKYIDKMRSHFDDVAGEEHYAQHGDAVNNLYYGETEDREL